MIQDLIILGFLKKGPASGYDIKKFINKELGVFSKSDNQSIYYPLKQMERTGLISKKEARGSQELKKYVYSITAKGEKAFDKLCKEALLSQTRPFLETDVVLYFLPFLKGAEIVPLLRLRRRFLQKVHAWLEAKKVELKSAPRNLTLLLNHHEKLALAEREFLEEVIKEIQ
jgi:DNA-binding PadR family transcriptional regulator